MGISHSADPTEEERVDLTITGQTEAARKLYVYVHTGDSGCGSTGANERYVNNATTLITGAALAAGENFSKPASFTPAFAGAFRVCAYVSEAEDVNPNATATQLERDVLRWS